MIPQLSGPVVAYANKLEVTLLSIFGELIKVTRPEGSVAHTCHKCFYNFVLKATLSAIILTHLTHS